MASFRIGPLKSPNRRLLNHHTLPFRWGDVCCYCTFSVLCVNIRGYFWSTCAVVLISWRHFADRYLSVIWVAYVILFCRLYFFLRPICCVSDSPTLSEVGEAEYYGEGGKQAVWETRRWHFWNTTPIASRFKTLRRTSSLSLFLSCSLFGTLHHVAFSSCLSSWVDCLAEGYFYSQKPTIA